MVHRRARLIRFGLLAGALACAQAGSAKASGASASASQSDLESHIARLISSVEPSVIAWRRQIHANPELGNREVATAALAAAHLKALGFDVRTGIGHTGVVGVLDTGRPGRVVLLRADMDALPGLEASGLPFASKVEADYDGRRTPVMHACGHDAHTAMLLGAAEVLAQLKPALKGKIAIVFQPAEEGPPAGEEGGAALMVKEGALAGLRPDAAFALHVVPGPLGELRWRSRGMMTGSATLTVKLKGKQTHAALPWAGIDMSSMTADVIQGFNTAAARQVELTAAPGLITVATIHGGVRSNIIPEDLEMQGTVRSLDETNLAALKKRAEDVVASVTQRYGAQGTVTFTNPYPITFNDPGLSARLRPALARAADGKIDDAADPMMPSEDFPHFAADGVPGLYVLLGSTPPQMDWRKAPPNHSPKFVLDEAALRVGVRAHVEVATAILQDTSTDAGGTANARSR